MSTLTTPLNGLLIVDPPDRRRGWEPRCSPLAVTVTAAASPRIIPLGRTGARPLEPAARGTIGSLNLGSCYGRTDVAAEPSPDNPLYGSCLCGGVWFEGTAPLSWGNHCPCSRCRKKSGAFRRNPGRAPRHGVPPLAWGEPLLGFR